MLLEKVDMQDLMELMREEGSAEIAFDAMMSSFSKVADFIAGKGPCVRKSF